MPQFLYLFEEGPASKRSDTSLSIHVSKLPVCSLDILIVLLPNLPFFHGSSLLSTHKPESNGSEDDA